MQKQTYHHAFPISDHFNVTPSQGTTVFPLRTHVASMLRKYFIALGDHQPIEGLYDMIHKEVDIAVLTVASERFKTQTAISHALTLSRQTVRKKLKLLKEKHVLECVE